MNKHGFKSNKKGSLFHLFFLFSLLILFISFSASAQRTSLNYKVVQNGDTIGWVKLIKIDSAYTSSIHLSSQTKKRVIFLFTFNESQDVFFQNGRMMHSYVYRKINNDIKVNKYTTYNGDYYTIKKEKSSTQLAIRDIGYNQLSLYFYEPVSVKQIYSDHYEQFLDIEKTTNGYFIKYPDGNKNSYYYTNGICSKIKVEQSLFTVEFFLVP